MNQIRTEISPETKLRMEMSVAIANCVYDILKKKGITQKEFAKILGKTETEVCHWLSGTHNFTLETICKISIALNEQIIEIPLYSGNNNIRNNKKKLPKPADADV